MNKFFNSAIVSLCLINFGVSNELDVNIENNTIKLLQDSISKYHNKVIKIMPENVRAHLESIDKPRSMYDLKDKESVAWVNAHVVIGGDQDIQNAIDRLKADLSLSGDKIHGNDICGIFEKSFFALWNDEKYNIRESINDYVLYWREQSKPSAKVSPDGLNRIDWIWQLDVASRKHGVLHVGIDVKKRTFICYEYTVGLYFPEGETMERIYREIVQDQDMAGQFIGIGRKQAE